MYGYKNVLSYSPVRFVFMRQPEAWKGNMIEFCAAWMHNNGGTFRNAQRVWSVEKHRNETRL